MQSGRQTLSQIEGAIAQVHDDEARIDEALRSALGQSDTLRTQRTEALRELARVKLTEMAAGRLVSNLDAAETRAFQILEDRKHRLVTSSARRELAVREVAAAEQARHAAGAVVEQALAAVEATRAAAEGSVKGQAGWQAAKSGHDAAAAVAAEADKKASQSEAELGARKRPYDGDPLFLYLWNRNFGAQAYAAGTFARMMDRMVADFVGFGGARANYAMLIEIPARLREHATATKALAAEAQGAMAAIERRAMVAAGIDEHERALAAARHALAAAESTLDGKRAQLGTIDKEREGLLSTDGGAAYEQAIATIAAGDAQSDIATLLREARRTPTPADDTLIARLQQIDRDLATANGQAEQLRGTANDLARRRLEVENVRDRFRGAGYDHPHVTIGNGADIGNILGSVLEGVVRSGVLWDVVRGAIGTRSTSSNPDFGRPSWPFPFPVPGGGSGGPQGGGWREPSSQGGWSPPADSSGGGAGGGNSSDDDGNFSTGGSF